MEHTKICLITGTSSGIGYALAKALQTDGYTTVLTARRKDRLQELASASSIFRSPAYGTGRYTYKNILYRTRPCND